MKKDNTRRIGIRHILILLLVIAIAGVTVWTINTVMKETSLEIASDNTINVTPQRIAEIKQLGQWEFVSVVDEVVIDTVRHRMLLPDDRLACIYKGKLSIGIDLAKARPDWVTNQNDTIIVTLPRPTLLDPAFIDEAATNVFYQRGEWGATAREQMYARAAAKMKAFALTDNNLQQAQKAATARFDALFRSIGAKEVVITFE